MENPYSCLILLMGIGLLLYGVRMWAIFVCMMMIRALEAQVVMGVTIDVFILYPFVQFMGSINRKMSL